MAILCVKSKLPRRGFGLRVDCSKISTKYRSIWQVIDIIDEVKQQKVDPWHIAFGFGCRCLHRGLNHSRQLDTGDSSTGLTACLGRQLVWADSLSGPTACLGRQLVWADSLSVLTDVLCDVL
jgi:hypothetical protein